MSADNWTTCPGCILRSETGKAKLATLIAESYGKVSIEEHDALREKLANWPDLEDTFREDYEITGAEDGTVTIVYRGSCTKAFEEYDKPRRDWRGCGAHLEFKAKHDVEYS